MPCCPGRGGSKAKNSEAEATFDIHEIQPRASILQSWVLTLPLRNLKHLKQELKHRVGKPEESDDQADKLEKWSQKSARKFELGETELVQDPKKTGSIKSVTNPVSTPKTLEPG